MLGAEGRKIGCCAVFGGKGLRGYKSFVHVKQG